MRTVLFGSGCIGLRKERPTIDALSIAHSTTEHRVVPLLLERADTSNKVVLILSDDLAKGSKKQYTAHKARYKTQGESQTKHQ